MKNLESHEEKHHKLTPEQIQNWRKVLLNMFGPYAMVMSEEEVQKIKDKMQFNINKIDEEEKNED